jgi:CBS domain-containing protein
MKTVKQILDRKGRNYWFVKSEQSVLEALQVMAEKNAGALLVVDDGNLTGIISERDYARKVVLHGKTSETLPVREIMTDQVLTVDPGRTVEECMAMMTESRVRHMPVLENGAIVGVVSIGDLVREVIDDQKFTIEQLEHYISS